eukprot:CAMPEP_0174361014 /NCGR_PEP_ID=MMETSP0811_2-20130205/57304_1 /TAXON_ID=73025 ORGANISM="Eutreptiella gymnastica-like, Strain CCMP1594" /NCGR_SAMPLE_ID=MMETSP0811_2 /ASSEMBLY_ACC=CAM_ASM_000667 /LENGTH=30 /DNA_ID= /DNA_START= /DNA_END= /DNA_ORIENTATION=
MASQRPVIATSMRQWRACAWRTCWHCDGNK